MQDKPLKSSLISDHWPVLNPGELEIRSESVSCQEVLDEVAAMLYALAQAKGLRLDVVVPITEIKIKTDRRVLSQILLILVDNAIRQTDTGSISIEVRRRLNANLGKVLTEFSVEDAHVALPADQQAELFKKSRKRGSPGTRTLARCQRLAHLIGGRIVMMSAQGQGTIFRLVLPEK